MIKLKMNGKKTWPCLIHDSYGNAKVQIVLFLNSKIIINVPVKFEWLHILKRKTGQSDDII